MPPPPTNNPSPPHSLKQTEQEYKIPQQCQRFNKDQLPHHPHVPHHHADNGPCPRPLHRQMAVKITYLSKWEEASMTPSWTRVTGKGNITGRRLACSYQPDKWDQAQATTGMTLQETTEHFQLLNNAHAFLRKFLDKKIGYCAILPGSLRMCRHMPIIVHLFRSICLFSILVAISDCRKLIILMR
jgi:hypothetical protein